MPLRAWVTVPPHANFLAEVAAHPAVEALRFNTVFPVAEPRDAVLQRLIGLGKPVWIDLKGRQLRLAEAAVPPFTAVRLTHRINVPLPAPIYFRDGTSVAQVVAIEGDRLILDDGPRRVLGPGESVNIPHPGLQVEGHLTDADRAWIAAAPAESRFLLSFAESDADLALVTALSPGATVWPKIESWRGYSWALAARPAGLMIARGDLYVEVGAPHQILRVTRRLLAACPGAVVASRVLDSLAHTAVPDCAELSDLAWIHDLGGRRVMLGDSVCLKRDTVLAALDVIAAFNEDLG